jgi:glycosyltransferase involved in cell wall biosynthesis
MVYSFFYSNISFITVSPSTKKDLSKLGIPKENIAIIYNGLDHKKYKPGKKSKFPHIIYLGRLEKSKRVDLLIKGITYILQELPNVKLSIVGTGKNENKLRQLVRKLRLDKNVKFYGYVRESKKIKLLQNAWILVSPSIREGWGLSVLEANACGTPAIAFNVPGLRDSIKDKKTGILIKNQNEYELAKAMLRIITNKKLRYRLSKNSIKWSKKFNWDFTAEKILSILRKMVND